MVNFENLKNAVKTTSEKSLNFNINKLNNINTKEELERVNIMNDIKYFDNNNNFIFTCPKCGHDHEITPEFYEYQFVIAHENYQTLCNNCNTTLFLSYGNIQNKLEKVTDLHDLIYLICDLVKNAVDDNKFSSDSILAHKLNDLNDYIQFHGQR